MSCSGDLVIRGYPEMTLFFKEDVESSENLTTYDWDQGVGEQIYCRIKTLLSQWEGDKSH